MTDPRNDGFSGVFCCPRAEIRRNCPYRRRLGRSRWRVPDVPYPRPGGNPRMTETSTNAPRRRKPGPDDASAGAVLAAAVRALGGEDRPGQQALTEAVAAAIAGGHHLVAEAPTGSGKGLAYLA